MIKLSIYLPAIRPQFWMRYYHSIQKAFSDSFELIMVGPFDPVTEFMTQPNTKFIKDFGSPARCLQIALLATRGEFVVLGADDSVFHPNALDIAFQQMNNESLDGIILRYTEGTEHPLFFTDDYWRLKSHICANLPQIDKMWFLAMNCIIQREKMLALGGYDCRFELTSYASNDMGIRLQKNGNKLNVTKHVTMHCDLTVGGDHKAIEDADIDTDRNNFNNKYSNPDAADEIVVDANNWTLASKIWFRRQKMYELYTKML